MNKIIWLLFLVLFGGCLWSQDIYDPCECSYYTSFHSELGAEVYFPSQVMKERGIKEIKIYILPRHLMDSALGGKRFVVRGELPAEYTAVRMEINPGGWVIRKDYWGSGEPNYCNEYQRDGTGKILKEASYYLDSLGKYFPGIGKEIEDYTYNAQGWLIKVQARDHKGNVVRGEGYNYTQFEYDEQGRRIKTTRRMGGDIPRFAHRAVEQVRYDGQNQSVSTYSSFSDTTTQTTASYYDTKGREIRRTYPAGPIQPFSIELLWTYDDQGRRRSYESRYRGSGVVSECPDNQNFREDYQYDADGVLTSMVHRFGTIECAFRVELVK